MQESNSANAELTYAYRRVLVVLLVFTVLFSVLPTLVIHHKSGSYWATDYFRMDRQGGDYVASYAAGQSWRQGKSIYDPNYGDPYSRRYSYPPLHAIVLAPLTFLSVEQAYYTWIGISITLLLLAAIVAARLYHRPWVAFSFVTLVYLQSSFLAFQFERGQTDALVVILVSLLLFAYLRACKPFWPALFFVLAAFVKVFPAVLGLMLLLRREYRILFYAALIGVGIVILTGPSEWLVYVQQIIPGYANYYLGATVEHSLFYFVEAFVRDHASARVISKAISLVLIGIFSVLVILNKDKKRYALIECAIILTIAEVATPWSANYKLLVLLFLFLSPLAILEVPYIRRRPILGTLPLFFAFLFIVSPCGDQLTRLPFSLYVNLSAADIFPSNFLFPVITERKVAFGILIALLYLLTVYTCVTCHQYAAGKRVLARFECLTRSWVLWMGASALAIAACALVLIKQHTHRPALREVVARAGYNFRVAPEADLVGYRTTPRPNKFTQLDLIYRVRENLPENYMLYVHIFQRDSAGGMVPQGGANFYPSVLTSLWPGGKYIVVQEVLTGSFDGFKVGFFHPTLGVRYGTEAVVDLKP